MMRILGRCPFCDDGAIALDERPDLVFGPDGSGAPCPHLAWVDGRYSQWEVKPTGVRHLIGSTEFRWDPPTADAAERTEALLPYLKELLNAAPGWPFAPAVPFQALRLSAEEKTTDAHGHSHPLWEVDGWGLFAADPAAFWDALPACQERQLAANEVEPDDVGQ